MSHGRLVLLALVALAACGGSDTDDAAASTTTAATASVEQVASVVARHAPTLRDLIEAEDDCLSFECLVPENLNARWSRITNETTWVCSSDLAPPKAVVLV